MTSERDHQHIERLIPWFVNGTLNEDEMDSVNEHLERCRQCAASVEHEVSRARALRSDPPELQLLLGERREGWRALAARLPRRTRRPRSGVAAVVLLLTIAVAAGTLLVGRELRQPAYRTLTDPTSYPGPMIQLVFEPSTPEHEIRQVVRSAGGTLVAGPTSTGIYRIGLPEHSDGGAAVLRLEQLASVRWVALEQP